MSGERERFLERVRSAVRAGNQAGAPPLPERGAVGYQGAGADPLAHFCSELTAAGGRAHVVADGAAAVAAVVELVRGRSARRALLGGGAVLSALPLKNALGAAGVEVVSVGSAGREGFFAADVGVSGVDYLIAETGSLAVFSAPDQPRSLSLLPPAHVAVATREQLLPDLFDLFERQRGAEARGLPACLTLITGPSKTGDIELRLVTGVHGPGEVDVVIIDGPLG